MNKTTHLSIDNKKFDLEESAAQVLQQYLTSIQNYFSSHGNKEEILSDMENSIAEKFIMRLGKHKEVITQQDVEEVIQSMGTLEDFQHFEGRNDAKVKNENIHEEKIPKKLYRDKDNKVLGGVALGLAVHFNIDVSFVRAFFVLTTIFWGFGLILYLVLWVIMPEAKTVEQKIEMYGGQTALYSIQKKISSQSIAEKNETQERIRKAIGIFLIAGSSIAILFGFVFLFIFGQISTSIMLGLVLYAVFILPFLILMYVGRSLMKNKKVSKYTVFSLILFGLLFLFIFNMLFPRHAILSV